MGVVTHIAKEEGALFQSAELEPEVDLTKLEEVLVIRAAHEEADAARKIMQMLSGEKRKP
jgi:rod shape-determining protein MreC